MTDEQLIKDMAVLAYVELCRKYNLTLSQLKNRIAALKEDNSDGRASVGDRDLLLERLMEHHGR